MPDSNVSDAVPGPFGRLLDGVVWGVLGVVLVVHALSYLLGGMLMEGTLERLLWSVTFLDVEGASVILVGWTFLFLGAFGVATASSRILNSVRDRPDEARAASDAGGPGRDPAAALRERYVRGELDVVEFERRLERLLERGRDGEAGAEREGRTGREDAPETDRERSR